MQLHERSSTLARRLCVLSCVRNSLGALTANRTRESCPEPIKILKAPDPFPTLWRAQFGQAEASNQASGPWIWHGAFPTLRRPKGNFPLPFCSLPGRPPNLSFQKAKTRLGLQARKVSRVPGTIVQEVAYLAQQVYQDTRRLNRTVTVSNEKDCQRYLLASLESRGYTVMLEEGIREAFEDYRGPQKRNIMMLDRKARPSLAIAGAICDPGHHQSSLPNHLDAQCKPNLERWYILGSIEVQCSRTPLRCPPAWPSSLT